jgi:hypothetical protein
MKRLVLALITAAALALPAISAHAYNGSNGGTAQGNQHCQNGTHSSTGTKCIGNNVAP